MARRKVPATWNENYRAHVDTCACRPRWVALLQLATDIFRIFNTCNPIEPESSDSDIYRANQGVAHNMLRGEVKLEHKEMKTE